MSASKVSTHAMFLIRLPKSVTPLTSHVPMAPWTASVPAGSAQNSSSATLSAALSANVPGSPAVTPPPQAQHMSVEVKSSSS